MDKAKILEKLKEIFKLVTNSEIDINTIKDSDDIFDDLGVNSVGLIYMAVTIENTFEIDLTDVENDSFRTVKDVVDIINERINLK